MASLDLPKLPLRMWREIFLRSPAESVFRYRAVCKGWRKVIDYPSFSRAHTFDHLSSHTTTTTTLVLKNSQLLHTVDLDALAFCSGGHQSVSASSHGLESEEARSLLARFPVSTCNGLILVHPRRLDEGLLEIWNPSTLETLRLPHVCFCPSCPVLFGLGYDSASQDLKVVAVDHRETRVYCLRSDTWWKIDTGRCPGCVGDRWPEEHAAGVFAHGALHWLLRDTSTILAFDLATEKYRHIELKALLPATKEGGYDAKNKIDVLGGCLAVSGYSVSCFNVWVIKDYGDESWTKLFSIKRVDLIPFGLQVDLRPVAFVKEDKKQVFLIDGGRGSGGFFVFDLESDSLSCTVRVEGLTGDSITHKLSRRTVFRLRDNCCPRRTIFPLVPTTQEEVVFRNYSLGPTTQKTQETLVVAARF